MPDMGHRASVNKLFHPEQDFSCMFFDCCLSGTEGQSYASRTPMVEIWLISALFREGSIQRTPHRPVEGSGDNLRRATMLSNNQINHRAYLASDLWKKIRAKAIAHYGTICNSCGGFGSDVHHKTYKRTNGNERMSDLEVLCRDCHDVKHSILKADGQPRANRKRPWIHAAVAFRFLNSRQRETLCDRFGLSDDALKESHFTHKGVMLEMRRMLGVNIIEARRRVYQKLLRG